MSNSLPSATFWLAGISPACTPCARAMPGVASSSATASQQAPRNHRDVSIMTGSASRSSEVHDSLREPTAIGGPLHGADARRDGPPPGIVTLPALAVDTRPRPHAPEL